MTQLEFYKSFQFIMELLIAEGLFCFRLSPRRGFVWRLIAGVALVFLVAFFFPILSKNAFYMSFMFFALFAVTVPVAKFIFREDWLKIVFCCLAGYTVQHMAYEMYNLFLILTGLNGESPMGMYGDQSVQPFPNIIAAIMYFTFYGVTYFYAGLLFASRIRKGEKLQLVGGFLFLFVFLILIVDIVLNAVVVCYIAADGNKLYLTVTGVYNILCCVVALLLQFESSLRYELEETLNTMNILREQEKEQYRTSKQTIELINRKCHDLKHQIRSIGNRISINEESVKEMEDLIAIYDSAVRTGNEALDLILTEKNLFCTRNGVKLSCIADGKQLAFMKEEDIYSLFGNLLDNAIEAVQSLEEGKRVIGLRIRAVGTIISVNVHNYYEQNLTFEDGIPQTTKSDKEYHGFGLKSVQYICEKYGGDLSINAGKNVFTINILFSTERVEL